MTGPGGGGQLQKHQGEKQMVSNEIKRCFLEKTLIKEGEGEREPVFISLVSDCQSLESLVKDTYLKRNYCLS